MSDFDHRAANRLAYRIIARRRIRCQREGKHDSQWQRPACKNCGCLG